MLHPLLARFKFSFKLMFKAGIFPHPLRIPPLVLRNKGNYSETNEIMNSGNALLISWNVSWRELCKFGATYRKNRNFLDRNAPFKPKKIFSYY